MGRVSRDARLLFVMLWPVCDDHGRTRAASRLLANTLFPYDDDAKELIDGWLDELERENCIQRYEVNGSTFLQICNWLNHQKIDKPSKPQFPEAPEISRTFASIREHSSLEGKGREGKGKDQEGTVARSADADDDAAVLEAFNSVAEELGWSKAQRVTPTRKTAIGARLRECGGIDGWRAAMSKARASPFLRGETGRDKAHANWTPDLDFFLQQSTFTKLMEGKYDKRGDAPEPTGLHAAFAGARAAVARHPDDQGVQRSSSGPIPGTHRIAGPHN
jgi:hypothetical protein